MQLNVIFRLSILHAPNCRTFCWQNNLCIQVSSILAITPLCGHCPRGRNSSVGIATRYGLDGPGIESRWGARFSAPVQTAPGAHPASYTMGTGSLLGVKRPGRGADHPPPSSVEVEGRVELYICSPSGPSWSVLGRPLPLPLPYSFKRGKKIEILKAVAVWDGALFEFYAAPNGSFVRSDDSGRNCHSGLRKIQKERHFTCTAA